MEYKIIHTFDAGSLENQVRIFIGEGWKPFGGVSVAQQLCDTARDMCQSTLYDAGLIFAQALVRGE